MSSAAKQKIYGAVCLVGTFVMVFAIQQMVPPGLAGDFAKARLYFILMIVGLVFALPAGVASFYYRARMDGEQDAERLRAEAIVLAQGMQKPVQKNSQPTAIHKQKHHTG